MFDAYVIDDKLIRTDRGVSWLAEVKRDAPRGPIRPGDQPPVITGDPHDTRPLGAGPMPWGMPNQWMARKGLDPYEAPVLFTNITKALPPVEPGINHWRCLVPVTSMIVRVDGDDVALRDPDRRLLTLAGLVSGCNRGDDWVNGFSLLTSEVSDGGRTYDAALVVAPVHYADWQDGWNSVERVASCCVPLLLSRLVALAD